MVSVQEARTLIQQHTTPLQPVFMPLLSAAGHILAEDIRSPIDIPSYPQSGMDGFAFAFESYKAGMGMEVVGEVVAGQSASMVVPPGKAVRIFTGAPVPAGTDTVVMQEKISRKGTDLFIDFPAMKKGDNVRPTGSEIMQRSLALAKGALLKPASIGFLAAMGLTKLKVYPSPTIALIITGNELQTPGQPLKYGQVYESNSVALQSALRSIGAEIQSVYFVSDQLEAMISTLSTALENHDLILITGGISVGDYDFTLPAAKVCGIETLFHKIRQKPGKPLFAGKKGSKLIFGLPGNPSSVLTCYYEYVTVALSIMEQQNRAPELKTVPAEGSFSKPPGLSFFLKGIYDGTTFRLLPAQESYKLNSFAIANCLAVLPEESNGFTQGDLLEIHLLP